MSANATRRQPAAVAPADLAVEPDEAAALLIELMPRLLRTAIAAMHGTPHTDGMTLAQFKILGRLNERAHRAGDAAIVDGAHHGFSAGVGDAIASRQRWITA